ncbi:MAG: hypothetical protein M1133_05715 [Armatimonadetes bacterium]|nr:hypothetical protein [Armatimonadota bacterium]
MRIAVIGLCDPGYSEELAASQHGGVVAQLRQLVSDVTDVGLQSDERKSSEAVSSLLKSNAQGRFDALVLVQAAWSRPDVLLQLVRAFPQLPMLLYVPGSPVVDGVIRSTAPAAGAGSTIHILRRHGIPFKHVWSMPGTLADPAEFMPFLRACQARAALRGTRLGMVGFGDMRLHATGFDVQELHETFGVEVESIDMLELWQGMMALDNTDVDQQIAQFTSDWRYTGDRPSSQTLWKIVSAYMVLDRMSTERGYSGLSIKCPTGVTAAMEFTPCMVGSLIARKHHYVCENDIPGLLGQVILGLLSDHMSTYWELYEILQDAILFGCCGFCPADFLDEPVRVRTYEGFLTGIGCCSRVKTGEYTIARLGKDVSGRYLLHATEGLASEPPAWYEDACGTVQHPSVAFKPDVPISEFLSHLMAQHVAVVPGRWGEALREFASLVSVSVCK